MISTEVDNSKKIVINLNANFNKLTAAENVNQDHMPTIFYENFKGNDNIWIDFNSPETPIASISTIITYPIKLGVNIIGSYNIYNTLNSKYIRIEINVDGQIITETDFTVPRRFKYDNKSNIIGFIKNSLPRLIKSRLCR